MAAISSVVWSSWPSNGCLSLPTRRLSLPTRRSSLITCSSGPRSSNSDSENPSDWDTAWQKLKEKKQALESTSGTEIAKVERSPSDVEDKYADIRSGRDVGPSFTKEEERKLKKVATIATNGLKEAYVVTFSSKKCFECVGWRCKGRQISNGRRNRQNSRVLGQCRCNVVRVNGSYHPDACPSFIQTSRTDVASASYL